VRLARYGPESKERIAYRGEMHALVRTPTGPALVAGLVGSLAAQVRRHARGADVLHVHWWVPGMLAARAARPTVPTVLTVHGTDVALLESRPGLARLARWAISAADRVEAVSADLADRLERATGRAADAINPMPLERDRLHPPVGGPEPGEAGRPLRVLAVGRLVLDKGFLDLVAAAGRLERPVHLTIIGEGPLHDRLEQAARQAGVPIELPGRVAPADLQRAYARADVVAQPSHREGLGLVAAEAVCAGVPVVATDSGGVRDVLGGDGLLPVGDVAALAAALQEVAADPAAARDRAAAAAAHVRARLSPEAAAERTLAAYRALGLR
jgi:glycosyltransferase involved in cell wall biosynthesis